MGRPRIGPAHRFGIALAPSLGYSQAYVHKGAPARVSPFFNERKPAGFLSSRRRQSRPGLAAGHAPLLSFPLLGLIQE
jgi:hypothetical protein